MTQTQQHFEPPARSRALGARALEQLANIDAKRRKGRGSSTSVTDLVDEIVASPDRRAEEGSGPDPVVDLSFLGPTGSPDDSPGESSIGFDRRAPASDAPEHAPILPDQLATRPLHGGSRPVAGVVGQEEDVLGGDLESILARIHSLKSC